MLRYLRRIPKSNIRVLFSTDDQKNVDKNSHFSYQGTFRVRASKALDALKQDIRDDLILDLLKDLRGLRFGYTHRDKSMIDLCDGLRSKLIDTKHTLFPTYMKLILEIGIKDQNLWRTIFREIRKNFHKYKHPLLVEILYNWSQAELYNYDSQIDSEIKEHFLLSTKKFADELRPDYLAKSTVLFHTFEEDSSDILRIFSSKYRPETVGITQIMNTNSYGDLAYAYSFRDSEQDQEMSYSLLEAFIKLNDMEYDLAIRDYDLRQSLSQEIGFFSTVSSRAALRGLQSSMNIKMDDSQLFKSFEDIILRQVEYDLVSINDAIELMSMPDKYFDPQTKSILVQNLSFLFTNEPYLVPSTIESKNLYELTLFLASELKNSYFPKDPLRSIAANLINLLSLGELDGQLSDFGQSHIYKDALARIKEHLSIDEEIYNEAIENIEICCSEE